MLLYYIDTEIVRKDPKTGLYDVALQVKTIEALEYTKVYRLAERDGAFGFKLQVSKDDPAICLTAEEVWNYYINSHRAKVHALRERIEELEGTIRQEEHLIVAAIAAKHTRVK